MNTIQEMNSAQLHIHPETGEDTTNTLSELSTKTTWDHNYNLRPRPTRMSTIYDMYSMMQSINMQKIAKPHMHVMMMQMSVKEGIIKFGNKGNDALMKELHQIHIQQESLPLKKGVMSYEQWKCTEISYVPERKVWQKHQGQGLCRWMFTKGIHY